jgi:hypothetical protein
MKGYIGCDEILAPGSVIITGHSLELKVVVVRAVTEAEAREAWAQQGTGEIEVQPDERFYEVEVTPAPIGSLN